MLDFSIDVRSKRILQKLITDGGCIAYQRGISKGFYFLGRFLVLKTKDAIKNPPKTGRIYRLSGALKRRAGRSFHQASAPGEAPANLTGDLRRGVSSITVGCESLTFGYSSDTLYGRFLELGTRKMEPRPNLLKHAL